MSFDKYIEIEQEKLKLSFKEISLFTQHGTTLGNFRESLIKGLLRKFTPEGLHVKSGFVCNPNEATGNEIYKGQSRQIDCMVFEKRNTLPLFETDDLAIIEPNSLFASIEIKSNLTFYKSTDKNDNDEWKGTLVEAIKNIKSIIDASVSAEFDSFTAIIGYECDFDYNRLYHALDNGCLLRQLNIENLDQLPICICVPGKFLIILTDRDTADRAMEPYEFESYFNYFGAVKDDNRFPFHFFLDYYRKMISYRLNGKNPNDSSLMSMKSGKLSRFSHHFDLISKSRRDSRMK